MKGHAVLILRDGKKVLFVQRAATKKTLPNVWTFPSGTIEEGETPEITALREAHEELKINIVVEKYLGSLELPELDTILHFMVCKQNGNQPIIADPDEIQQTAWLTFDEFFSRYDDTHIGHGLRYLRKNPHMWQNYENNV